MTENIGESFRPAARRLIALGLGYLSLDRASSTLSTGERQRMQLARAVRNRTTGVLYVLDDPSIGLHPSNITGLTAVMRDLKADGNSVVLVDHDTQILSEADWIIEMGPVAGAEGGYVIAEGTVKEISENKKSMIGEFLSGKANAETQNCISADHMFDIGEIRLSTSAIHTVKPLEVVIPKGRLIDATPIGINVRSTVATYANVHDELRKVFAKTDDAKQSGYKAGDFSYNTGKLRCSVCDGTGAISLDVQFLPDVNIPCPECGGSRYVKDAYRIAYKSKSGESYSLPEIMSMDVNAALTACKELKTVSGRLEVLQSLGLGYLTLGEETPGLSGGEAQRLKLASEMGKAQTDSVFVFDEPTIGLHPLDVQTLLGVFRTLVDNGATVIVIEHDLDVIRCANYIIDMGPEGGGDGGRIVAAGTPEEIKQNAESVTGRYL